MNIFLFVEIFFSFFPSSFCFLNFLYFCTVHAYYVRIGVDIFPYSTCSDGDITYERESYYKLYTLSACA